MCISQISRKLLKIVTQFLHTSRPVYTERVYNMQVYSFLGRPEQPFRTGLLLLSNSGGDHVLFKCS